jgi:hypothetical protein
MSFKMTPKPLVPSKPPVPKQTKQHTAKTHWTKAAGGATTVVERRHSLRRKALLANAKADASSLATMSNSSFGELPETHIWDFVEKEGCPVAMHPDKPCWCRTKLLGPLSEGLDKLAGAHTPPPPSAALPEEEQEG